MLVIVLGWALTRFGFLSARALRDLNRLTYWVGLPCLLFYGVGAARPAFDAVGSLLLVATGATFFGVLAGAVVAWRLSLSAAARGVLVQGVFRGNLTFIGLPIVFYAFAGQGMSSGSAEASALLAFGPLVVLYNVLAVTVLMLSAGARRAGAIRGVAYGLVSNPILISCLAGLAMSLSGLGFPEMAGRTLSAVGQMALPLALICIGGTLHISRIRGRLGAAFAGALMKVSVVPAAGLLLAWWVGLSAEHTRIALILLACPTASASYVLAGQLGGDEALASSIIVISNVLAIPAMVVVLLIS